MTPYRERMFYIGASIDASASVFASITREYTNAVDNVESLRIRIAARRPCHDCRWFVKTARGDRCNAPIVRAGHINAAGHRVSGMVECLIERTGRDLPRQRCGWTGVFWKCGTDREP